MIKSLLANRYLLMQISKKDIKLRYQGTVFGVFLSFIVPLLMLIVYTFVFSEVFKVRWSVDTTNKFEFAVILFCGLNAFTMLSEVMGRSTSIIISNTNYVKKVMFPLETLPFSITFSAFFNCLIGYVVLILGNFLLNGFISKYILLLSLALIPLFLITLAAAYFLSGISVYFKDLGNLMGVITTVLMYMSPIFYSLDAVPQKFSILCKLNPMTFIIENLRNVVIYNKPLDWMYFTISMTVSLCLLLIGALIFNRVKPGFADVL